MQQTTDVTMQMVHNQTVSFVSNFFDKSIPYILSLGLTLAVLSLFVIGLKLITHNSAEERVGIILNFKWVIGGVICLGLFFSIFLYIINAFFKIA